MKNISLPLSILILGVSISLTSCGTKTSVTPVENVVSQEVTVPENIPVDVTKDDSEKTEDTAVGEQTNLAPSDTPRGIAEGGLYLPYTPTALAQASGNIVLFFYASWSPVSIATNKDITDKKDTLPKDLTVFRVNFDDAESMKQQYGVTAEQTFVQVTNTGELIKKWRGANTLEDIVQQIKK